MKRTNRGWRPSNDWRSGRYGLIGGCQAGRLDIERFRSDFPLISEIPFSSERKMMTTIHSQDGRQIAITKGAPGVVLARCSSCSDAAQQFSLADERCQSIRQTITKLQSEGMYVLGLASHEITSSTPPAEVEQDMIFLGLLALIDPPRPHAAQAIAEAHTAGIRVVMITGDNGLTAQAIAGELGIGHNVVEAHQLEGLTIQALSERMVDVDIVAHATHPQIKQRVLQAFQKAGHFVAMTGDGVNDATALKQSDVGVAMGLRGTDIAKNRLPWCFWTIVSRRLLRQ